MPQHGRTEHRAFMIKVLRHRSSDLLTAVSDDLKGLAITGRSEADIERRIKPAVEQLLVAQGLRPRSIDAERVSESRIVESPIAELEDARLQFVVTAEVVAKAQ